MHLLLTRPQEDSEALAVDLAGLSHRCTIEPMLTIAMIADAEVDFDGVQAVLLTSANGARALASHPVPPHLPVLCVGAATATAARQTGFRNVDSAGGDVVELAALVRQRLRPGDGALLHVAGSAVAGDLAGDLARDGYVVRRAVLYRAAAARTLSPACVEALKRGAFDGVIFFSPRSAASFATLIQTEGLDSAMAGLAMYALSPAVASAAAILPWHSVHIAAAPEKSALLALLRD